MTTKAIFWDNDGVLVDTERLYYTATKQVLATVGVDLSL
jgi:beta-phosphoglucomutase-like phosphatase (HAD superfamily)